MLLKSLGQRILAKATVTDIKTQSMTTTEDQLQDEIKKDIYLNIEFLRKACLGSKLRKDHAGK